LKTFQPPGWLAAPCANQRKTRPATIAPANGATQNNQSCSNAQPSNDRERQADRQPGKTRRSTQPASLGDIRRGVKRCLTPRLKRKEKGRSKAAFMMLLSFHAKAFNF
jgi:hypothetical protein